MAPLTMQDALDRLYAEPPGRFVTLRKEAVAQARADGDADLAAAIGGLRKPAAAAWLVNRLARRTQPPGIPQLADLGERLRTAQAGLDAAAMKQLGAERNTLIPRLVADAVSEDSVSGPVRDQLTQTFVAALADAAAQQAVCSGHLVNPLSYSGFGEVEVDGAVAVKLPAPAARDDALTRRRLRRDLEQAQAATARISEECATARQRAERARAHLDDAERQLAQAQDKLQAAQRRQAAAEAALAQLPT